MQRKISLNFNGRNLLVEFLTPGFKMKLVLLSLLLLSACQTAETSPTPTATNPPPASATPTVTATPLQPTATITASPTPAQTATQAAANFGQPSGLVFVSETFADGTNFQPGEAFRKTWTVKNGGSLTWDSSYVLALVSSSPQGETLGSPQQIPLPNEVAPGESLQFGVDLQAPQGNGQYTLYYQLADGSGTLLSDGQLWVTISVGGVSVASSSGITADLQGASRQGGQFTVSFCMQLPDNGNWYPWAVTLSTDQQTYNPDSSLSDMSRITTDYKCFDFNYQASLTPGTAYQLSIGKVTLDPAQFQEKNCARAQEQLFAAYPGLKFNCNSPGMYYTGLILPAGMTEAEADTLIKDALSSAIYGPWVLSGTAP